MSRFLSLGVFKDKNQKSNTSLKHEKLAENWGHNASATKQGVTFYVKYLGSTLLEELGDGMSYGDHVSSEAVKVIVNMAKVGSKKLPKMELNVSPSGITVINSASHAVFTELDIYRICFCTADKHHDKVFAYIARSTENDTIECHAFLCPKRKIAEAVTLTVAESFKIAKTNYEKQQEETDKQQYENIFNSTEEPADNTLNHSNEVATGILVNLTSDPEPTTAEPAKIGFEDNFTLTDVNYASVTESWNSQNNPFTNNRFSTGLVAADVDESVRHLMTGQEPMERHTSVDDDTVGL